MSLWQRCPNCGEPHDVSVHVSGQRLACRRCALRFEVVRRDVQSAALPATASLPPPPAPTKPGPPTPLANSRPKAGPEAGPEAGPAFARSLVPTSPARPASVEPPTAGAAAIGVARPAPGALSLEPTVANGAVPPAARRRASLPSQLSARHLPGFELVDLLGRGGMGEVWRARQLSLGREVAVKVLSPELAQDPDFVRRFDLEANALTALAHPHVVAIIDRGHHGGLIYFAMEFVEGKSLRERLARGPLAVEEALRLVGQVLLALSHAHKKGIVHRDLKPENVLLAVQGGQDFVKVADFGLAAMAGATGADRITKSSVAMGTMSYMAPEQRRDAHAVDQRADLYSAGVVLYELLTGEVPSGRFELPSRRRPGVPRAIDRVLEQALAAEPDGRFPTATEMALALQRGSDRGWLAGLGRWRGGR